MECYVRNILPISSLEEYSMENAPSPVCEQIFSRIVDQQNNYNTSVNALNVTLTSLITKVDVLAASVKSLVDADLAVRTSVLEQRVTDHISNSDKSSRTSQVFIPIALTIGINMLLFLLAPLIQHIVK